MMIRKFYKIDDIDRPTLGPQQTPVANLPKLQTVGISYEPGIRRMTFEIYGEEENVALAKMAYEAHFGKELVDK
jgi:hypothetical protein